MIRIRPALFLCVVLWGPAALAQNRTGAARSAPPPPAVAATPPAAAAPVPATPQQTTASFADWTLRCSRVGPAPGTPFCELEQGIQRDERPVAQFAIGRPGKGQPMQLTILVPPNVGFGTQPSLAGGEGPALELSWRRCLPAGCTADAALSEDALKRLRGWTDAGRISFADAAGRQAVLPFSPRGLAQALDALGKED